MLIRTGQRITSGTNLTTSWPSFGIFLCLRVLENFTNQSEEGEADCGSAAAAVGRGTPGTAAALELTPKRAIAMN